MTTKERDIVYSLCGAAVISIFTGLWPNYDKLYYLGIQLIQILLLYAVYSAATHKTIKVVSIALIVLSLGECLDEVIGNNLSFHINDYVLVLLVLFMIIRSIRNVGKR